MYTLTTLYVTTLHVTTKSIMFYNDETEGLSFLKNGGVTYVIEQ
jgi:hypothetical protein